MLSVILITKNEEAVIRSCLESIKWAEEIVVLDSGSSDRTCEIAREYTDKVHSTDWPGYGLQKQRALALATQDWVLNLDADESVTPELKQAILQAMHCKDFDAYRIPIRLYFYEKLLRFSGSPSRHIRLFRRAGAQYSKDIVHEKVVLAKGSRVGRIKAAIRHQSFQDLSHALEKMNRYSSYSAKIKLQAGKPIGLGKAVLASSWMFLRSYFLQAGFLDGAAGFVIAALNAQSSFARGIKQVYPDKHLEKIP